MSFGTKCCEAGSKLTLLVYLRRADYICKNQSCVDLDSVLTRIISFADMVPPFLAAYGVSQGNYTVLLEAFTQIKLYRSYLIDPEGSGLWRHVVLGNWGDAGLWGTVSSRTSTRSSLRRYADPTTFAGQRMGCCWNGSSSCYHGAIAVQEPPQGSDSSTRGLDR